MAAHRLGTEVRFVLLFALCAILFELAFVAWLGRTAWFVSHLRWNASVASTFLKWIGVSASSDGIILAAGTRVMELRRGCDAVEPTGLFLIGVLLFPSSWKAKLRGALIGAAVLTVLNLARVVTLALVPAHEASTFDTLHVDVWPMVFLFVALCLWTSWALRLKRTTELPQGA